MKHRRSEHHSSHRRRRQPSSCDRGVRPSDRQSANARPHLRLRHCRPAATTPATYSAIRGTSPTTRTCRRTMTVGTEGSYRHLPRSRVAADPRRSGRLDRQTRAQWGAVLPWGHDGLLQPIDASVYTIFLLDADEPAARQGADSLTDSGLTCIVPFPTDPGWIRRVSA